MPLIDSDMILAYIKKDDRHQESAEIIFGKIIAGELEVYISSSMFVEIAFVLKRNNQLDLLSDVYKLIYKMPNISIIPISENIIEDAYKHMMKDIGILDSIQAATALRYDKKIISTDHIFDKIKGLIRIKPEEIQ
ncbi:MAG: type II toxin-antitoxin system VapC family toxin [Candidatus Thorarchaeota archaeon]